MKITKSYLRQLIRENLEATSAEQPENEQALRKTIRDAFKEMQMALKGVAYNSEQEKQYFGSEEYTKLMSTVAGAQQKLKAILDSRTR